jgi:hypothetical protein
LAWGSSHFLLLAGIENMLFLFDPQLPLANDILDEIDFRRLPAYLLTKV